MSLLNEHPPISHEGHPIRADFRVWMQVEDILYDISEDAPERIAEAITLVFPTPPEDTQSAVDFLIWFYRCGRENEPTSGNGKAIGRPYDYEYDSGSIYAAFLEQYGVDLVDVNFLHWWKFRSMFRALNPECEFVKIMGFRTMEIGPKLSKEQQAYYRDMKRIHALPLPEDVQEQNDALLDALKNGGDLRGVI